MSGGAPKSEPASNSEVQGRIAADVQRAAAISSNASGRRRTVSRHLASGGDDREPMKASVSGAHGAEARRDRVPGLETRVGPWPMQDDAPDRVTRAPTLSSTRRRRPIWARASDVRSARSWSSCSNTYAAAVRITRSRHRNVACTTRSVDRHRIARRSSSPATSGPSKGPVV